jgi:uncharacterized membrane protein YccC
MPSRSISVPFNERFRALLGQMDWYRGLRAAIALCAPMLLGYALGNASLGWAGLGGFEAIISDAGGPYRRRLAALATVAFGGALGLTLGTLVGGSLLWALPVVVLFCFAWSYLAVLGQPFNSAGSLVQVIFICGIGAPSGNLHEAVTRGLLLMAGSAWAAVLSLLLWPLDSYRPARTAVSSCYTELASFLASVKELAGRNQQNRALWHRLARHHQYRLRRVLEQGWQALAAVRARRQAETQQGQQLVVLLEHADILLARTIAIAEHMESQRGDQCNPLCHQHNLEGLEDLRSAELWIASLLLHRQGLTTAHARAQRSRMRRLPAYIESHLCASNRAARFLLQQITEAASVLDSSLDCAAQLRMGGSIDPSPTLPHNASTSHFAHVHARLAMLSARWSLRRVAEQLAANFKPSSLLLRHAARVALVCGLDEALIQLLHIDHGYWLLLTSLIVLQPHVSGTLRRGLERIAGTVAGGVLAAVLAFLLHSQLTTAIVLFPLALLALAILPVNYTAFSFFLTPTFVLAWLPFSGDWQLALIRTGNTIGGALISVLAMLFFFPSYERERAPQHIQASLAADRRYLEQLAENWRTGHGSRLLANARRASGLAHNDTEESMDRLLAENWPRKTAFGQFVPAFVTYLRRLAQTTTTLAALEDDQEWKQSRAVQARLKLACSRLLWLEQQTGQSAALCCWPEPGSDELTADLASFAEAPPGERLLERIERQVVILFRQLRALRDHGWLPGHPGA